MTKFSNKPLVPPIVGQDKHHTRVIWLVFDELDQRLVYDQRPASVHMPEFDRLRGDFEKQSMVMSEQARKDKQAELEKKGGELQGFFVQLQKDLSEREREATRGIFDKMHAIVREIADAEGVSMVVQAEALAYATPSLDITNELVRKYNARHKAGGATSSGKSGAEKKASAKKETK